uniref:GAF domain-containing protein n=1 Tax=uncultured Anaerolinea sp. TaxID=430695 RepID=UPI0026066C81
MNAFDLGLIFIITGLVFFGVVRLLAQTAPKMRPVPEGDLLHSPAGNGEEAVLVVEAGGRVRSLNERARQVFQLREDEIPDLERLVRHARPVDALMMLCAGEGRARFVLNGRFVEGVSYALTFQQDKLVLVSLRFPELTGLTEGGEQGLSSQTLQTFTELTRAMAASLDLEQTLTAVLEGVEKIVPADYLEVGVWDSELRRFVFFQLNWVSSSERRLEQDPVGGAPGEGYTGFLYQERVPLLITDISRRMDVRPAEGRMPGIRSFMGLPLMADGEFVGTLELGSRVIGAFREEDLGLIRLLAEQAALAIRNALVFQEEKKRSTELSRLSQLTQAFGSMRDPKSLFSRLVENVARLIKVHIAGFLLYQEAQRVLEAQIPFYGLPDQITELYRVNVGINSPLENALLEQDVLLTEDASTDPLWENLGLAFVAQAASLHETVLVPLQSGGRMLGYLQVSNRLEGGSFTQSELNLLMIVSNQVASIIENALLVQQSRQRAQRAEALRQIVSLTSSAANLDEILQFSVQELARLLRAEVGAVFLMDQARTTLSLHRSSFVGPAVDLPERVTRLQVDDAQFPFTITESQEVLRVGLITDEVPIIPFYRHLLSLWNVHSVLAVPLVVRSLGVGELWFGN